MYIGEFKKKNKTIGLKKNLKELYRMLRLPNPLISHWGNKYVKHSRRCQWHSWEGENCRFWGLWQPLEMGVPWGKWLQTLVPGRAKASLSLRHLPSTSPFLTRLQRSTTPAQALCSDRSSFLSVTFPEHFSPTLSSPQVSRVVYVT